MSRILVTGAAGFVGSALVRRLSRSHEVLAVARSRPTEHTNGIEWLTQDLAAENFVLPGRVETVIHLAQSRRYRDFPAGAPDVFAVSTAATAKLLDWAARTGVKRFVFASTGGIYAPYEFPLTEESATDVEPGALALYFAAKRAAELIVSTYTGLFSTIILRCFFMYGPGQSPAMLMPRLVGSVREGRPVHLAGENGINLNPIFIDDAAAAMEATLGLNGSNIINVAGPQTVSLRQIVELTGKEIGRNPVFAVDEAAKPRHLVADISRMSKLLIPPRINVIEGVRAMCASPAY